MKKNRLVFFILLLFVYPIKASECTSTLEQSSDLPLTIIPSAIKNDLPMVFFISGDGGWTSFDQALSESIAKRGMPVVGLNAQKYFWNKKTPEITAAEISKATNVYLKQWHKKSFILMGFSFGASVAPFVAERFSVDMKKNICGVFLFSPDENADFEIHVSDMLNLGRNKGPYNVLAEILKNKELNPICIFGKDEKKGLEEKLVKENVKVLILPGGHYYENDYSRLTDSIFSNVH